MSRPLLATDPRRLGGYELVGRLGEGGMGAVFLGRDPAGRYAAVKVIRAEYAADPEFRGRFRSEVNRARQVPPFCTAEVLDADPEHETPYLVVEYVDGPNLTQVVSEQGPLSGGALHSVAVGVATAIAAIHGAGVIHRDLKPGNVLFSLGSPKVIDFGIARAVEVTSVHTRTDQMVGTVAYMAPERFENDSTLTGPAADVFAWGAVVTYAGTGRTPFAGDSPAVTAAKILTQPPELSGLPDPLRGIVARTLAKDPRERPTAHELLDLLLSSGAEEETFVRQPELRRAAEAVQKSGRPRRRGLLVAAAAAATAVAALIGTGLGLHYANAGGGDGADVLTVAAPASRQVRGLSVVDPLTRPGQWKQARRDGLSCVFGDDGLTMTVDAFSADECPGPDDTFEGDQTIAADVAVLNPGSCATLRYRWIRETGYLLSVCRDKLQLDFSDDGSASTLTTVATSAFARGAATRVRLELRGTVATVLIGDKPLFQAPPMATGLTSGRVTLGVDSESETEPGKVRFADVEILSV
ncbi:serine/threonine-protein kinase [Actinoplanes sp. RD1]|uniref:serine/threonine-protein kinase n=1 Tax=Actinoplanes sp. RD1 TaxID=3064538 RepID=UPI002740E7A3|nr:serine/threonine-protein kinase [Actinoplanes sp. RD1]